MAGPAGPSAAAGLRAMPGAKPLAGILTLIASTWFLSGLDASGKWVMAAGVSLWVFCWIRFVVHLLFVLALVLPVRGLRVLRSVRPKAQLMRGAAMLLATLCIFKTLSYLPQAEATAINFLAPKTGECIRTSSLAGVSAVIFLRSWLCSYTKALRAKAMTATMLVRVRRVRFFTFEDLFLR